MEGKHGSHMFRIKHDYCIEGDRLEPERVPVLVHDNTELGLDHLTMRKIAEKAMTQSIFFNEVEIYYWMFDFKVWDHWCEMVNVRESAELFNPLEINVYE